MAVYILTHCENTEASRILRNLGVFTKRSLCIIYLKELIKTDANLKGGNFKFDIDELINYEQSLDFNPKKITVYENTFSKVNVESSFLK